MVSQELALKDDRLFDRVVLYVAVFLFTATIALATVQVTVRQVNPVLIELGLPTRSLSWTEPTARFILILMTYVGVGAVTRNDEHIAIRLVLDRIERAYPFARKLLDLFVGVLCLAFMLIIFRGAAWSSVSAWDTQLGGVGTITSGMIYLGMAIGAAVAIVYYVADLVVLAKAIREDWVRHRSRREAQSDG